MHTRIQKGEVYRKGKKWYLRYFDFRVEDGQLQRKRLCKPLCCVADMTKTQAREEAKRFLESINRPVLSPETAIKLVEFIESAYLPRLKQDVRPSTYRGYTSLWAALKPYCPDLLTRDVRTKRVQAILDEMARTDRFNKRSMQHVKFFLSGAFGLAIRNDYYTGGNPVTEAKIPAKVRGVGETHAYGLEEVLMMLDVIPEPARTLLAVAAFAALRRGELRGLRWEDYRNAELHVGRSVWNGIATDPKTEESKNAVPVIPKLAAILAAHRERQGNPISGWIFPNGAGNAADPNNVLQRVILPALKRNGILWHGWHAFRRGVATNLNRLGVPDKIIQRVLRHSDVAITQAAYIKPEDKDSKAAMEKFETAVNATQLPPISKVAEMKHVM